MPCGRTGKRSSAGLILDEEENVLQDVWFNSAAPLVFLVLVPGRVHGSYVLLLDREELLSHEDERYKSKGKK